MNHELLGIRAPAREGLRDKILLLRSLPLFAGLDDDGMIRLAEHARSVMYREGETVTREGEPARAIHVIVEGEVQVFLQDKPFASLKVGTAFGAFQVLAREPSRLALAVEFTRTLEVPMAAFETALDENYSLLRGTLRVAGAAALEARGNLPVDPNVPHEWQQGSYYERPKTMVERLIELRAGSFGYMNLEALVDLARHMKEVRFPAGQALWRAGDLADHSLHIDYGRVRCTAPNGKHVDIGCNFTLGVLDVWGAQRRAYTAYAETPVIAFRVDFENFLTLLESHVEVGLQILRGFARAFLESRALQVTQGELDARSLAPEVGVAPGLGST